MVTGASSGIGAATAGALAAAGFDLVLGARRMEQLKRLAADLGARAKRLDLTDAASVASFGETLERVHLLVNNAGAALGLDPVEKASENRWRAMWELNFLGVVRMSQALLPALLAAEDSQVINIGSTAGFETYRGGAGYTSSKHALRALTRTLRLELLDRPVRVTEINPGLVETEFSLVRFDQDRERAAAVYRGMTPLKAEDVAACVAFVATRPAHVSVDEIVVRPRDQATSVDIHRRRQT